MHSRADTDFIADYTIPSLILFDSLDGNVHEIESKRKDMLYDEYAVIRFDGKVDEGNARRIISETIVKDEFKEKPLQEEDYLAEYELGLDYEVEAVKVKDHLLVTITNKFQTVRTTIALQDSTRFAYLSLTGELCLISNVEIKKSAALVDDDYIPRIAEKISYIDVPQGDIPNLQIDGWRSASSEGIAIKDNLTITFHSKSLPTARLIWHCPFICLFYSDDKIINGKDFHEFVLIRLDGENWEDNIQATNSMQVNKTDEFENWETWKALNKKGLDWKIEIHREGNKITTVTQNGGISIKNITTIKSDVPEVYAALTGDQVAITNIRIK